jgi:FAD/FMN-containing dehydrogenase
MSTAMIEEARAAIGAANVLTADLDGWAIDWRRKFFGKPLAVLRPGTTAEVATVVRLCARHRIAMVPQGGNTGMCGAATVDASGTQVVLSLSRLNRIRDVDPVNNTMTVEAGCILQSLQDAAAAVDRLFPLSLGAEGSCQIGGNVSTNAGGVAVLRFGNCRELVLGLEVVLADGEVLDLLRGLRKDNTGYDLKQLFIGAEGTLGVVTAAVVKLFPAARQSGVALAAVADPRQALALLALLRGELGDKFTAFELISSASLEQTLDHLPTLQRPLSERHPWYLLIEATDAGIDGTLAARLEAALGLALEDEIAIDVVVAASEAQSAKLWAIREGIPEAQAVNIKHDISLPLARIPEFLLSTEAALTAQWPGARVFAFGHLGDGNLHYNVAHPQATHDENSWQAETGRVNRIVHDATARLGGSISAEHGLGQTRNIEIARYKSALELDVMRRLKHALDPHGLMNPGKVLAADSGLPPS